ncbi:hypothetical protein Agabi119p4_85 [Agaricus bisporus var. burnettii]|uniref:Uncharacterized protein n=1 Tax=Agaricus bisporus var. burnettii TaxID=192524 RepID=A0A8H7FA36_AGABI|nr:hypothetical protein Agabi119p4_85 [Agaricus bisporus var. burnettii]
MKSWLKGKFTKAGMKRKAPNLNQLNTVNDARSPTTSVVHIETRRSEYEACQVDTIARGGFFSNTHHFVVKDSTLVDQSTNMINHGVGDKASTAKKLLSKHMIPGAAHDSSARDPPPKCHPGTRIKINELIVAWFYDEIKQEMILWISGPAGVDKSAIVQTFAEAFALTKCLGASLAVHIEPYCAFVSELLAFDPEIVNKSMEEQFKAFIIKPFVEKKIGRSSALLQPLSTIIIAGGWLEEIKIVRLAHAASGLFAFADVAIRFVGDPNYADPITRLDDVLSVVDGCRISSSDDQPFALLDALVLGAIAARKLLPGIDCVKGLSVVLGLPLNKVYASINDLYSLLDIPPLADVYDRTFRFHHASFVDFLRDATRSKKFHTSEENAGRDLMESSVRIWLDFKRSSTPGPCSGYVDQWSEYAFQFHSLGNQSADALRIFNSSFFGHIHRSLLGSLEERWSTVQREESEHHCNELLGLLREIDAGTVCYIFRLSVEVIGLWFDIWKTHREEFTSRGVVREIQLKWLHFESLEEQNQYHKYCIGMAMDDVFPRATWTPESFDEYTSYFKYTQQHYPKLQVLICGPSRSRFAMFVSKITKGDFQGLPPSTKLHNIVAKNTIIVFHCFPCSDDV